LIPFARRRCWRWGRGWPQAARIARRCQTDGLTA
jgi:hypothetical protein